MPKLEPLSIYLALARDSGCGAHRWAIFVPYPVPSSSGRLYRVVERPTPRGWVAPPPGLLFETKEYNILSDPQMFLLVKLGGLGDISLDELGRILGSVSIPHPDEEYSNVFDGRIWVIKGIMRLSAYGIVQSSRLEMMEQEIHDLAMQALDSHNVHGGWTLEKLRR